MEIKDLDQKGIDFLVNEEGLVLHPYKDIAGVWTIGIGMTFYPETGKRVQKTDPALTKEEAIRQFKIMLDPYEKGVWAPTRDDITQNQFSALVSFTYNEGVSAIKGSTLLRKVNANPLDATIRDEFLKWTKAGNDPKALKKRRTREADLYFS